ncbi:MAG: outer membrane beta-barrel protein [Candidatus Krumholzibacteria bacterium]|nr:outer membrane beta-barrel protein [Candidatus Krumholzibacteria bacterium]
MKRRYAWLIISAVLLSCVDSNAGTHGGGMKGGLLISGPSGGDRDAYKVESLNTLSFGGFYRYTFSNIISLQTELLYAHKGAKGMYNSSEGQIDIWYLDFVPSLQCRILDKHRCFGCLYAGPMYCLRMDAGLKSEFGGSARFYDIKSSVKPNDYGYVIGAKLGLPSGSNEFGVDVRYSSGFIAPDGTDRDVDLKNRAITVMLEMYFGKD